MNKNLTIGQLIAPSLVLAAVLAGLGPLVMFALAKGGGVKIDAVVWKVLSFTLWQATLSTVVSVALGLLAARALARRSFPGRAMLMNLFSLPQALPSIVVVLALVGLFGKSGWLPDLISLYGLAGIVLAHLFFNLPLATRFFTQALDEVPPENFRLAAQLGFGEYAMWRLVEWPALHQTLPRLAALIFLMCAASFVIVLTLGGPSATTLEVAIYQSLRLDFDVNRAVTLSFMQIALCGLLVALAGQTAAFSEAAVSNRPRVRRFDSDGRLNMAADGLAIAIVALVVLPPIAGLVADGLTRIRFSGLLAQATATSAAIATLSAALALLAGWSLARTQVRRPPWRGILTAVALAGLIVPPAVLATGWFIATRQVNGGLPLAVVLIAVLNALMALPFTVSALVPAFAALTQSHDRLCAQLGLSGLQRLRIIDLPSMRRPVAQAFLMAFVLSLGDLAAVTMLGTQGLVTLPSLIATQMSNYRGADASGTALALAALCYALAFSAQKLAHRP